MNMKLNAFGPRSAWVGLLIAVFAALGVCQAGTPYAPREGRELIGKPAPEFVGLQWIDPEQRPLTMRDLRGKVVLVRFWLRDCPFCSATAPALNRLQTDFGSQGLQVIGIHHPKSEAAREVDYVWEGARNLGFKFPVAMDNDWQTLRRWWLTRHRGYTSATLLVDRRGIIRWVHDGGAFFPSDNPADAAQNEAYRSLVARIRQLLAEP